MKVHSESSNHHADLKIISISLKFCCGKVFLNILFWKNIRFTEVTKYIYRRSCEPFTQFPSNLVRNHRTIWKPGSWYGFDDRAYSDCTSFTYTGVCACVCVCHSTYSSLCVGLCTHRSDECRPAPLAQGHPSCLYSHTPLIPGRG